MRRSRSSRPSLRTRSRSWARRNASVSGSRRGTTARSRPSSSTGTSRRCGRWPSWLREPNAPPRERRRASASGFDACQAPGALEPPRDVGPVEHVPDRLHVVGATVLVLQVIRVLPGVDDEERYTALADVALVVVDLLDEEALAERLPRQRAPPRALHRGRRLGELLLERVERAEVLVDRSRERAARTVAAVR